jgi:hypothetical protein
VEKALTVKPVQDRSAFVKFAHPIKAHGVKALEDISAFTVTRRLTVFLHEALNVLEPSDDTLLLWSAAADFLRLDFDPKLGQQGIVFVSEISH